MRPIALSVACGLAVLCYVGLAKQPPTQDGPYHVLRTAKVGGAGGFDYVGADSDARRLYVARSGPSPRINVFNLDTLQPVGEIAETSAHGAVTDSRYHHAFGSSKPVAMWDTRSLAPIKKIDVDGRPDGMLADAYNHRIYVLSHAAPNVTVIDANDGKVLGTFDIGGAPEQAVSDGNGHIYIDIEDADSVAVVDANTMKMTGKYDLNGKGGGNAGLAIDAKNHVLFVACRQPQAMVMLDANTGKYLADLPIGRGCDGAFFNPKTMECFSSQGDGTLTVIKETNPTTFMVEQNVKTMTGAKTLALDSKTGHIFLITAEYAAPANGARRGTMIPDSFSILEVGK